MATLIETDGSSHEIPLTEALRIGSLLEQISFSDGSSMLVSIGGQAFESFNATATGMCTLKRLAREVHGPAVFLSRVETQGLTHLPVVS